MILTDILARFEEHQIRRVKLGVVDVDGILRGKYISIDKFRSAVDGGIGMCDVVFGWDLNDTLYDNGLVTGWHTGYPDTPARIDLETFRVIPWEPGTAFFLMDLYKVSGEPLDVSPRQVLKKVIAEAEKRGFRPTCAAEYEFWMFRETGQSLRDKGFRALTPLSHGMYGYSVLRASQNAALVTHLIDELSSFDIPIEGFHTETGPGVYEAAINVDNALQAADKAALFKTAVKEIASRHGVTPTFMAKWSAEQAGSSGHIHQSLWTPWPAENAFFDQEMVFSSRMLHYIGGLVKFLPELQAIFCPTVNSYKRTVPGTWAPVNATWGIDSRTCAIRAIAGTAKSTRIELRLTGADINPYLAMAASLAAGLEGMEQKIPAPHPVSNGYEATQAPALARNLREATDRLRESSMARKWLGTTFVDHYCATRDWEMRQYEKAVSDWELARYFESI